MTTNIQISRHSTAEISGATITLADLRDLVAATNDWPANSTLDMYVPSDLRSAVYRTLSVYKEEQS